MVGRMARTPRGLKRREALSAFALLPLAACQPAGPDPDVPFRRKPEHKPKGVNTELTGDLVELVTIDPAIRLDMRYATANNFTGKILYKQPRAFMTRIAAAALLEAHRMVQPQGFGFLIYDAYRPWRVTRALWNATPPGPKKNYVANPKRGSRHNRGCAVDMTLYDVTTGQEVEMPSAFDDFSARAHRDYSDDTPSARKHALILEQAMQTAGFRGMSNEWWHFDFTGWEAYPVLDIPFEAIR